MWMAVFCASTSLFDVIHGRLFKIDQKYLEKYVFSNASKAWYNYIRKFVHGVCLKIQVLQIGTYMLKLENESYLFTQAKGLNGGEVSQSEKSFSMMTKEG